MYSKYIQKTVRIDDEAMVVEILQNKNAATTFRIMVEIAASGPNILQNSIAAKLGMTPQAISYYIRQLLEEQLILSAGRSNYKVSTKGINWILSVLRGLRNYISSVEKVVNNLTTCAAIAESDIKQGQEVGLKMKDGLLVATSQTDGGAIGIALSDATQGDDIDVASIEGLVELSRGNVMILQIPAIHKGGSKRVDLEKLKRYIIDSKQLGTIGIEALVSLRRIGIEPRYLYGVTEAAIEAAQCGLQFSVVCADDVIPELMISLKEKGIDYTLIDLRDNKGKE